MSRRLVVNDGRRERELALVDKIVVGRDPACDLVYDNVLLSRQDAVFTVEGERVLVRDLGSRIGVFVNGLRSAERLLDPGDVVQIGPLRIRYAQDRPMAAPPIEPAVAEAAIIPPSLRPARPLPPVESEERRDAEFETRYPRAVTAFPERARTAAAPPPADMDAIADDWSFPFEAPPMTSATLRSAAAAPAPVFTASVPPAPAAIAAVPLSAPVAPEPPGAGSRATAATTPEAPAVSAPVASASMASAPVASASVASASIAARAPAPAARVRSVAPSASAEPPIGSPLASFRTEDSSSLSRAMRRDLEADMRTYVLIQVGAVAAIVWLSSLLPLVIGLRMMGVDVMALDTRLAPWVAAPFVIAIITTYLFGGFITRRFFRLIRAMKLDWPPSDRDR